MRQRASSTEDNEYAQAEPHPHSKLTEPADHVRLSGPARAVPRVLTIHVTRSRPSCVDVRPSPPHCFRVDARLESSSNGPCPFRTQVGRVYGNGSGPNEASEEVCCLWIADE
eukprot:scaffold106436_cov36-Tisochrysis_lutea.AAC.2